MRASSANPRSSAGREAEVGERGARHAGAVDRQPAPGRSRVGVGDEPQQPQVRAEHAGLLGDRVQPRRARVLDLVDRVPEAGHAAPAGDPTRTAVRRARPPRVASASPPGSPPRKRAVSSTTPRNTDPPPSRPGGDRALQRLGRAGVGQPRGEHGRREPVVGERDEHRVEHPRLARLGHAPRDEQERQLGERHLAHQLARDVAAHDGDRVGVGGPDARCAASPSLIAPALEVGLVAGVALARQLVLGDPAGRRVRQLVDHLDVARDLERAPAARRRARGWRRGPAPSSSTTNALTSSSASSDGTPTTAASDHVGVRRRAPPRPRPARGSRRGGG